LALKKTDEFKKGSHPDNFVQEYLVLGRDMWCRQMAELAT